MTCPYPYAQNVPVQYRDASMVYQQPSMPPGVMIHPSSPIVWTAVQMTPQPNVTSRKHSKTNNTEEERKAKRKKRSKKRKSSKRKHHKAKKEGLSHQQLAVIVGDAQLFRETG
uniref:Uncharacterized protein n=1 Tax=Parascaris univalens TaxID=6257 RepID=A0A915BMD7_PARUN